jgi:SAM-dependent methyltransferase
VKRGDNIVSYNAKYSIDDLVHDGEIYDALNKCCFDLEFYKKWCKKAGGRCLELCCGTGRLTIPLTLDGIDMTGVDYTESMIKKARGKADEKTLSIGLFSQDMRELDLSKLSRCPGMERKTEAGPVSISNVRRRLHDSQHPLRIQLRHDGQP